MTAQNRVLCDVLSLGSYFGGIFHGIVFLHVPPLDLTSKFYVLWNNRYLLGSVNLESDEMRSFYLREFEKKIE